MKPIITIVLSVIFTTAMGQPPIIPLPATFSKSNQEFSLNQNTAIVITNNTLKDEGYFLQKELLKRFQLPVSIQNKEQNNNIVLVLNNKPQNNPGGYSLLMGSNKITISAADEEGIFNGIISLIQIATSHFTKEFPILLEGWNITDAPKYTWRGIMLDESRHFFGKEKVKEILDWMAFYKLNKFHWHLTDEPGWRLQILKYPLLTLVGGIGNYNQPFAAATYYSQENIKEIVAYAAERKIDIIPEIDMPGHATAANRAYPQYSGGGSAKHPEFTFDPGNEATYQYLTDILREANTLFPSQMIHLGGDEVSFGNEKWKTNGGIKKLMGEHNLKDLKDVEEYFLQRMADTVYHLNSKVLAWDEMANASLPASQTIIFWWRHDKPEQLKLALKNKFPVVVCPRIPFYFDFVQDSAHKIGRKWGSAFSSLEELYSFDVNKLIDKGERPLILGVQANIWTERIETDQRLDFMLFPRISALAETAWSQNKKDYNNFFDRLRTQLPLYKNSGIFYFNPEQVSKVIEPEK